MAYLSQPTLTRNLVICTLVLATAGCVTQSAKVEGAWQSPRTRVEPFDNVLVVAIAPKENVRIAFEMTMAQAITASGEAQAFPSHTINHQSTAKLSREHLLAMVQKTQADAVFITRILDQTVEDGKGPAIEVVHLGPTVGVSHKEGSSLTTVIASNYSVEIREGTDILKADNVLDTLVYEPKTGDNLVYHATTQAQFDVGPSNTIVKAAAVFAQAIATRLRKDGVIR